MNAEDYLIRMQSNAARCSPCNNEAERIVVDRGALEAVGHLLDPGINSDEQAFQQGWDWLCIETGGSELPRRYRKLFATGFWSVVATWRAYEQSCRKGVR